MNSTVLPYIVVSVEMRWLNSEVLLVVDKASSLWLLRCELVATLVENGGETLRPTEEHSNRSTKKKETNEND